MSNPNKIKGSSFERLAVGLLSGMLKKSNWKRIVGSGAIGTFMNEPLLTGDVSGSIDSFSKRFKVECKVGYNSSKDKEVKQFTLKKEWLDKIAEEAKNNYSIPFLMGKFSGAKSGVKVFVVMDLTTFAEIMNKVTDLNDELVKLQGE